MENTYKSLLIVAFSLLLASPAWAQNSSISQEVAKKEQQVAAIQSEMASVSRKANASQAKLDAYNADIEKKKQALAKAKANYAKAPTPEGEQFVNNAAKRVELAELGLQSRVSAVSRLRTKEAELNSRLATVNKEISRLNNRVQSQQVAARVKQRTDNLKTEMAQTTGVLEQRLAALERENNRLRQVAEAEAIRRQQADRQAAQALTAQKQQALAEELAEEKAAKEAMILKSDPNSLSPKERATAEMARLQSILASSQGATAPAKKLSLRSERGFNFGRFEYLGANQYRIDIVVENATARYRVGNKGYRVKVSEANLGQEFIFLYDLRDNDNPRLVAFEKALVDESNLAAE